MDKKIMLADYEGQGGGSVMQVINNLPGITTTLDGKVQLRGSD